MLWHVFTNESLLHVMRYFLGFIVSCMKLVITHMIVVAMLLISSCGSLHHQSSIEAPEDPSSSGSTGGTSVKSASTDVNAGLSEASNGSPFDFWLPLEYDFVSGFTDGYAYLRKEGITILIDESFSWHHSTQEYDLVNIYKNMLCFRSTENSMYGLMDKNGVVVVPAQYRLPLKFTDGLAIVNGGYDGEKLGFINEAGELVVDFLYDVALPFSDGLAAVGIGELYWCIDKQDEAMHIQYWFIDTLGRVVSGPFAFLGDTTFTYTLAYMSYSEGFTAFFEENEESVGSTYAGKGFWGFLDRSGNIAITANYIHVRPFSEGLAAVETNDRQWIYIDYDGNHVMEGSPADFSNDLAASGAGFIDKTGRVVIDIPDGYYIRADAQKGIDNFRFGLVAVYRRQHDRIVYGVMDPNGSIVLESEVFDEVEVFHENLVAVKIDGMWGVLRTH